MEAMGLFDHGHLCLSFLRCLQVHSENFLATSIQWVGITRYHNFLNLLGTRVATFGDIDFQIRLRKRLSGNRRIEQ